MWAMVTTPVYSWVPIMSMVPQRWTWVTWRQNQTSRGTTKYPYPRPGQQLLSEGCGHCVTWWTRVAVLGTWWRKACWYHVDIKLHACVCEFEFSCHKCDGKDWCFDYEHLCQAQKWAWIGPMFSYQWVVADHCPEHSKPVGTFLWQNHLLHLFRVHPPPKFVSQVPGSWCQSFPTAWFGNGSSFIHGRPCDERGVLSICFCLHPCVSKAKACPSDEQNLTCWEVATSNGSEAKSPELQPNSCLTRTFWPNSFESPATGLRSLASGHWPLTTGYQPAGYHVSAASAPAVHTLCWPKHVCS